MFGKISILLLSALLFLTYAQEAVKAPADPAASEPATPATPAGDVVPVEPVVPLEPIVPACDMSCFDTCNLETSNLTECGEKCHCNEQVAEITTELAKNERCWGECRQKCVIRMFTTDLAFGETPGDCFSDCSCICNRQCTESCSTSAVKPVCLQSCGCPANQNKTKDLLKASEDYFDLPLDPRSDEEISEEYQTKIAEMVGNKFEKKEMKERKVLNKKLRKIEKKWDEYVEDANKLGVNTTVFCNQTCSHDCFLEADQSAYEILTSCLIKTCSCFRPKLPEASEDISFDGLIALKNIILEEENKAGSIAETLGKQAEAIGKEADALGEEVASIEEVIEEALNSTKEESPSSTNKTDPTPPAPVEEPKSPVNETEVHTPEPSSPVPQPDAEPSTPIPEPEPATPAEPTTPTEPAAPVEPATPAEPATPSEPATPVEPSTPSEPATPVEPATPSEPSIPEPEPATPTEPEKTHSEILTPPFTGEQESNLTCFRDCLDLKKFVPFPVIEQCIDIKCHCTFGTSHSKKLEGLMNLASVDMIIEEMGLSDTKKNGASGFIVTLIIFMFISSLAVVGYLLWKSTREELNEKKNDYYYYGADDNQVYERLT